MNAASIERQDVAVTTTDAPSAADLQRVDAGLDAHNIAAAPLGDVAPLAAFAHDAGGTLVGGAVGRTWGACCELQQLWVAAPLRGRGIGTRLVQAFEAQAAARGCSIFYLTTLSFQAPAFYAALGYDTIARIDGYPNGIAKHLMHKLRAAR